jgi:hypothetical protein
MIKWVKQKMRNAIIESSLKSARRTIVFPVQDQIKTVGVITNQDNTAQYVKYIFGQAVLVDVLKFEIGKRPKENNDAVIYHSDRNWIGLPLKNRTEWFTSKCFDLLIDLNSEKNDTIEYICAKSAARFKVSINKNTPAYDLIIKQQNIDLKTFLNQIFETITRFNSTQ